MKIILLFIISLSLEAATCKKVIECLELSSQLTGEKILFDKKIVPFTFELNRDIELTKQNNDKVLSETLNIFGLAKIPTNLEKTFKVIEARDIRFHSDLPSYQASKTKMPLIKDTHDPIIVTYQGVKGVDMDLVAENVKPLLSRYGKVMPMRNGSIVISDLSSHVNKILPLIEKQDFPLTVEEKKNLELQKKREHELEMARLKSGELHEIGPHKHKGEH